MNLRRSVRIRLPFRVCPSATAPAPRRRREPRKNSAARPPRLSLHEYAEEWGWRQAALGASKVECVLPFLEKDAPRKVECLICSKSILPDEKIQCSIHHCEVILHKDCAKASDGCCPRHICFYCKKRTSWRCVQRTMPACTECSLQQNRMIDSVDPSRTMICWKFWPSTSEGANPTDDIKEAFQRLPLPYADREFNISLTMKEDLENGTEPPPYVHLKHNVYLVKHKGSGGHIEGGCTDCNSASTCKSSCSCSCSRACHCSDKCTNKPFKREKKVEIVKTQHCGWGARALESIEKGDFVIEFVGEVIDDVRCKERLADMVRRGDRNFYMCEISDGFIIDATFKGNACRFLNHSCKPNCQLDKWQVNGKTRVGVFASDFIEEGEHLTYNYRFHGLKIECFCGAPNCKGYL